MRSAAEILGIPPLAPRVQRREVVSTTRPQLIGNDFVFARYVQTREGFYAQPIKRIRFEPGGRVVSETGSRECWMPYQDGIALYAEGDRYRIPAVTFTEDRHGLSVGYLNVEGQIPHQVCLLSDVPFSADGLIILIAINTRFVEQTIPRLREQLLAAGVRRPQIKVVVNDSRDDRDAEIDGVTHAFTRHTAWEFSALFEAPSRFVFRNAFLLHDTCMVEPKFLERVLSLNGALSWDHSPACIYGRTCIGMYSRNYLERIHDWLASVDRISKPDAIITECAAEFIQRAQRACAYGGEITWGAECPDVWSTGLRRHHRLFPQLGLHKFTSVSLAYARKL